MSNKKTISPQDVMSALKDAELEGFLPRLEAELKSKSLPDRRRSSLRLDLLTRYRVQRHPMRQA